MLHIAMSHLTYLLQISTTAFVCIYRPVCSQQYPRQKMALQEYDVYTPASLQQLVGYGSPGGFTADQADKSSDMNTGHTAWTSELDLQAQQGMHH